MNYYKYGSNSIRWVSTRSSDSKYVANLQRIAACRHTTAFSLAKDLCHNGLFTLISLCLHMFITTRWEKTCHSRRHISLPRVIWLYYNANSNSLGYLQCVYYKLLYLTTIYIFLTHNQYTWILSLNIFPTLYGCFSDVEIFHMSAGCGRGITDIVT